MKHGSKMKIVGLAVGALLGIGNASATMYDLTPLGVTTHNVPGDFGGTAIVSDYFSQPTGTGVFEPFLTLDANGQTSTSSKSIEQGYNTDGFTALYMDQHRPQWNERLRFGDLADININGKIYYAFLLDSNEPDGNKVTISVDNIRIYTSATDNTAAVGNNLANLDSLGTLRWALNNPTVDANGNFDVQNWIKLDSSQENVEAGSSNSNGGSGKSDMVIYVPQTAFEGAKSDDWVWFYNLNGVNYTVDKNLGAQAGYEEWRAVTGPHTNVPDGGATALMFGGAALGLLALRRRA